MNTKTRAIINLKGGVGKTAMTWCLGDYNNTLVFDLDAQRHLLENIIPFNIEEV